jgi:xanthine dehydrogenase YagS FAD-binding subunit
MQAFEYASPTTPDEAAKLLAANWGETEVLAGGTDLLSLMKDYIATPKRVVSLHPRPSTTRFVRATMSSLIVSG